MKFNRDFKWLTYVLAIVIGLNMMSCENSDSPSPDDQELENIGILISESSAFTRFAALIDIADAEIPTGERGIMEMLTDTDSEDMYSIFAPSDAVFELLRIEWNADNVDQVIGEFTHNGLPSKTRDFVLGHIFVNDEKIESEQFRADLALTSGSGVDWKLMATENIASGFGFVLANNDTNPYPIYETDVILGSNGIVHSALVN